MTQQETRPVPGTEDRYLARLRKRPLGAHSRHALGDLVDALSDSDRIGEQDKEDLREALYRACQDWAGHKPTIRVLKALENQHGRRSRGKGGPALEVRCRAFEQVLIERHPQARLAHQQWQDQTRPRADHPTSAVIAAVRELWNL